jgi:hypothetical protein
MIRMRPSETKPVVAEHGPREWLRKVLDGWDRALRVGHESSVLQELDQADDLFMLLCFSECYGLPNPASWYTLELYPLLLEEFHDWHRRMGMERSPLDHLRCC